MPAAAAITTMRTGETPKKATAAKVTTRITPVGMSTTPFFRHFPHALQHERADRDADAGKGVLHHGKMGELLNERSDDRDDDERRETMPAVAVIAPERRAGGSR